MNNTIPPRASTTRVYMRVNVQFVYYLTMIHQWRMSHGTSCDKPWRVEAVPGFLKHITVNKPPDVVPVINQQSCAPYAMFLLFRFSGLLNAVLEQWMSLGKIAVIGSIFIWMGMMGAAFSPNITWMTFTFGFINGLCSFWASLVCFSLFLSSRLNNCGSQLPPWRNYEWFWNIRPCLRSPVERFVVQSWESIGRYSGTRWS